MYLWLYCCVNNLYTIQVIFSLNKQLLSSWQHAYQSFVELLPALIPFAHCGMLGKFKTTM